MLPTDWCKSLLRTWTTMLVALIWSSSHVDAVRCFCDKRNCENQLVCDGEWCLVGFKTDGYTVTGDKDVRLDQMCASADAKSLQNCETKHDSWEEVCSCNRDFCNTFNFLRTQMEKKKKENGRGIYADPDGDLGSAMDDPIDPRYPKHQGHNYQSKQLIILLVVVPLGVGAAAVCLVFLNYHCKMC